MDRTIPAPVFVALSPDEWTECAQLLAATDGPAAARLRTQIERTVRWAPPGCDRPLTLALSAGERALLRQAHQQQLDALLGPCELSRQPARGDAYAARR